MHRGPQAQRGAGFGVVMLVIALLVFFGNLAVNMVPAYLAFLQVRSSMASIHAKTDVLGGGPPKIMTALWSQLYMNNIRSLEPDSFSFERTRTTWVLTADYEVRKHIFMNVDVVMHFVHSETYPRQ